MLLKFDIHILSKDAYWITDLRHIRDAWLFEHNVTGLYVSGSIFYWYYVKLFMGKVM